MMEAINRSEVGFSRIQQDQQRLEWRRAEEQAERRAEPERAEGQDPAEPEPAEGMEVDEMDEQVKCLMKVIGRVEAKQVEEMWKMEDVDMVEIYSPPRVVLAAAMYGLKPGESMD